MDAEGTIRPASTVKNLIDRSVRGEKRAPWMALCERAAVEQDSAKLLELVKQINDMLSEKQHRSEQQEPLTVNAPAPSATKSAQTRILLADDSQRVRASIKTLIVQRNPKWEVSEATNGQESVEKVLALQPDVLMLDLNLPDMSGHEVVPQIRRLCPRTKIILCSFNDAAHL